MFRTINKYKMSSNYTPNLMFYLEKLNSVSTNYFKLFSNTGSTASANNIIRISVPNNSLVNLKSVALYFGASTAGTTAGARLPANIASLIERYELTSGGVTISSGCNMYNVLVAARESIEKPRCDPVLGHPAIVRQVSYVDGTTITTTGNEVYSTTGNPSQFCIDRWEGILDSIQPSIFPTGLVSDLSLNFYLADNNILTSSAGVTLSGTGATDIDDVGALSATYSLSNIHLNVECMALNDSVYDNMVDSMIASTGSLRVGFTQYVSYIDSSANTIRFSLSTQSLDRLWVVHRQSTYSTQAAPIKVAGYVRYDASNTLGGISSYDAGGVLSTGKEQYIGPYFNFPAPTAASAGVLPTFQFSLNSSLVPMYQANWEEMYGVTRNSVMREPQDQYGLNTLKTNFSVQCLRLCLPDSGKYRIMSGLDCSGVNLSAYYNLYGSTSTTVTIFCEFSSFIEIGAQKMLNVIF